LRVRRLERVGDLRRHRQRFIEGNRAARDVGMVEGGEDFGFSLRPRQAVRIAGHRGQRQGIDALAKRPHPPAQPDDVSRGREPGEHRARMSGVDPEERRRVSGVEHGSRHGGELRVFMSQCAQTQAHSARWVRAGGSARRRQPSVQPH
jgi:hypothetical protein